MSEVTFKDGSRDVVKEIGKSSQSLRGPLILAKMIIDALEKQKQGDGNDYGAIIGHLSIAEMKPVVMQRWLQALNLCVSQLTKEYDLLVGTTLRMAWYNKEPEIVQLYIEYLTNLISAQTCYLRSTLLGVIKLLWLLAAEGECVYRNVHEAINAVLKLVPSAPTVLMPLLRKNYPFKGRNSEMQELAIRNVFHITTYCPTLKDDILELVIHQMLTIDVEVPQLVGDDEHDLCTPGDTQFHVELEAGQQGGGGDGGGQKPPDSDNCLMAVLCQRQIMSNESAEKLDIMMDISFQYLEAQCFHNGTFIFDEAVHLLRSLFKIFERVVLPTHACSHVQFLLFRLTSLHESFPGIFLDFLWEKFQDPNTALVLRQTIAAYIASYVARAKFVPLQLVNVCLNITTQWIHKYMDACSPENMKPDVKLHGPFFSLCQAVFYIFVFRHKALVNMEGGSSFLRQLYFERIVLSQLNPLKVCLPSVVDVFASLTSRYEIVFCYTILEQNKRLILSMGVPSALHDSDTAKPSQPNMLDCFFPFDPYYLRRSSKHVHPLYQVWDDVDDDDMADKEHDDHSSVASSSLQSESFYGSHSFNMDSQSMPKFSVSPH